ncbi:hypothetical protein IEQ11_12510 [Lysobacter capsici]|uniref:hypothetical protein n=1 Tax=Lysobacter capsici TaxID=435897 RepID=UPI00178379E0|nr:hypothetical protein [Lysobacter capsici]UOF17393.1 hypothetical protein IEQ11_12510 [Lysobacter capsici]
MGKRWSFASACALWLLLAGCTGAPVKPAPGETSLRDYQREWYTPSTASTFSDDVRRSEAPLTIFYDRKGNLYPSAAVPVATNELIRGFDERQDAGTLRGYFAREATSSDTVVQRLARDAGLTDGALPSSQWSEANWQRIQAGYRRQLAARIEAAADGAPVVFVIHGYRNNYEDARDWYTPLDGMILQHEPRATLVHVYWDGTTGWRFLHLWKQAQYNMAFIGLEFRRLLNELPADMPIRIITHSTGAPLVANAMGDASEAFRENGRPVLLEPEYYVRAAGGDHAAGDDGSYAVKRKSRLRFAAVAPAATLDTFKRYDLARDIVPERITMALNPRDSATGKYFLNCELYGSSCMAVRPVQTCKLLVGTFAASGTDVGVFDFSRSKVQTPGTARFWRKHSVMAYSKNDRWTPFLRHLLTDADTASDTQALCAQATK